MKLGHAMTMNSQMMSRRLLSHKGFTLIEMLLVLGAVAILFGAIYSGFERLNRYSTAENVKAGTQQSARIGVETMVQDIRLAGLDPLGSAGAGILVSNPTAIRFTADLNFDGDLDDPFEDITYALNGTNLEQTNHLGTDVLLENVSALGFNYILDSEGNIEIVDISLTVTRPSGRYQPIARTYGTQVRCRNL